MLRSSGNLLVLRTCRLYATTHGPRAVPTLQDASLETFRREAFEPALPALLPRGYFDTIPAVARWFMRPSKHRSSRLNIPYLSRFGATIVPLEISNHEQFSRVEQSFSFFLDCIEASESKYIRAPNRYFSSYVPGAHAVRRTATSNDFFSASPLTRPTAHVYLAQVSLADLPLALSQDVPTPDLVLHAGKGDVYDSSIWLGLSPTYTPLHRDPNPNLLVQLAGKKIVRLFRPEVGHAIFAKVQERIGGNASSTMRGEEMMQGIERKALEEEVWVDNKSTSLDQCWDAELDRGDAIFIPKGWWHSVKGLSPAGERSACIGSVNWWFR